MNTKTYFYSSYEEANQEYNNLSVIIRKAQQLGYNVKYEIVKGDIEIKIIIKQPINLN